MALLAVLFVFLTKDTVMVNGTNGMSCRIFVNDRKLCFQYKAGRFWSEPMILDSGDISEPSIAIRPGDYLHIVWCKEGRVYYKTTLHPITPSFIRSGGQPVWSEKIPVSTPPPQRPTEPASNPFIEADGEWVYVVWRGPNEEGQNIGEIWQRRGRIQPPRLPVWEPPENKSKSPQRESNYPTMSTGSAVVWQESLPNNREIYAHLPIPQETVNISRTPTNSFYPHTNLLRAPPYVPYEWRLFSIWTESMPQGFYRVIFNDYFFRPRGEPPPPVVEVIAGLPEASPYCLKRDGYIDFGEFSVDYSDSNLTYKIPYLHPKKYYLLEALLYHDTTGAIRERFIFEDGNGKTTEIYPAEPETLRVIIPPGTYDNTEAIIEIRKLLGEFSILAGLRVYEFEIVDKEMGGPQDWWIDEIPLKTSFFSPFPNPFSKTLRIRYQLSKESRVNVLVYDITGREVKRLVNEIQKPGIYMVNFESRDETGRRLPFGIYFIRLRTEDFSDTKKVVLTR